MAIPALPIAIPPAPIADPKLDTVGDLSLSPLSPAISISANHSSQSSPITTATTATTATATAAAAAAAAAAAKRKPSRRANTAERRATHNAVERQRRETLNGRFLDLAALLPNLSQIRRPSKSSIVNSSIAHIHASRRHRLLASRELRMLKIESDALRRELNEWRERSGIPRVDEPVRGDAFAMIISGDLEVILGPGTAAGSGDDGMDDDEDMLDAGPVSAYAYGSVDGVIPEDEYPLDLTQPAEPVSPPSPHEDPVLLTAIMKQQQQQHHHHHHQQQQQQHYHAGAGLPLATSRPSTMSGVTNVPATYEAMYDPYSHLGMQQQQQMIQQQYIQQQQQQQRERERERVMYARQQQQEQEKMWGLYNAPHPTTPNKQHQMGYTFGGQGQGQQVIMMQAAQRTLFTPPTSSHGLPTPSPSSPESPVSDHEQQQQQQHDVYGGGRARSGSRGSSHSPPSFELGTGGGGGGGYAEYGVPRAGVVGVDAIGMGMGIGIGVGMIGVGV